MTTIDPASGIPAGVSPEVWEELPPETKYRYQLSVHKNTQIVKFLTRFLFIPPVLYVAVPPVHWAVNSFIPRPGHFVKVTGEVRSETAIALLNQETLGRGDIVDGTDYPVTSEFSSARVHPVYGDIRPHNGVDIGTPEGTPLYAPAIGSDTVTVDCWWDGGGGGWTATITSESIPTSRFKALHLRDECKDGDYKAGDVFAYTGATGVGTNAHLDWRQQPLHAETYDNPQEGYLSWVLTGQSPLGITLDLTALREAIVGQESGGNHLAVNPDSGALGLGQVMPFNLEGEDRGWDYEALGIDLTTDEFLSNPDLQNRIIDHKLGEIALSNSVDGGGVTRAPLEIVKRTAATWYSGDPDYCASTAREYYGEGEYPSGAAYCAQLANKYKNMAQ